MRNAFADELVKIALEDPKVVLLSGDIGNRLFDKFKDVAGDRFFNCGVAEANMTGVAAGLAQCGLKPITYTITSFNTFRCYEQIKIDVCYQNLPVLVVGVGAGLSYSGLGATHHSCEDISILRTLPNMQVLCPGDAMEVRAGLRAALASSKPTYIRLGKKGEPLVHPEVPELQLGKAIRIRNGHDVAVLSTGNMLPTAVEAAKLLEKHGLSTSVDSVHTVKPLDEKLLQDVFTSCKVVISLEEHSIIGGFSSAISDWLSDNSPVTARFLKFATPDLFLKGTGSQLHARKRCQLTAPDIESTVLKTLGKNID